MRTCLLPVPLLFSVQLVIGQVYFDQLYGSDTFGEGFGTNGVLQVENGYLGWGFSYGNQKPYFALVDFQGVLLNDMHFEGIENVSDLCFALLPVSDTIFLGLSLQEDQGLPSSMRGDYGLYEFTISGFVLSSETYGDTTMREIPQNLIRTTHGGFLLIGQKQFLESAGLEGQMQILHIDSFGDQQWEKTFGGSDWDAGSSAIETPDGGFLLLGWTRSFGAGQRDFYLVKTDALGNEQWRETYGSNGDEGGKSILALSDGNYLLTGGGSDDGVTSYGRLYKVDPSGDVVWTEDYVMQNLNSLFKTIELSDGSLVSVGGTNISSEGDSGWLIKTDADGNLIWQRKYNKNNQTDLFYSVLATEDGGFLLSGQTINEETMSQDAWLLKVDSIGCPYPNCTVGIDELGSREIVVDVWPNPATDVLNIEIAGSVEKIELQVYDVSGKRIMSQVQNTERGTIDVSNWASGIYILRGTDNREKTFSMKIVVE